MTPKIIGLSLRLPAGDPLVDVLRTGAERSCRSLAREMEFRLRESVAAEQKREDAQAA